MVDAYMRGNIGESGVPLAEVETRWNAANASEDWVWKGGAKAQTLAEWISDGNYRYEPTAAECNGSGGVVYDYPE